MNIQMISTGRVKISQNWQVGKGDSRAARLINALADRHLSDWLPIYCTVIEHPEGLIVVDTGIPADASKPVFFPPHMLLLQHASPFQMSADQVLSTQMRARGLDPRDVRWVISTHLHQDHDGDMDSFPNAEFLISRREWATGQGWGGRMNGYFNWRWQQITPRLIDFTSGAYYSFTASEIITQAGDVRLVPTPGHSAGHLSVIVEQGDHLVMAAGDVAYAQDLLLKDLVDGVGPDPAAQHDSHRRIVQLAAQAPTIFLPSHDPASEDRLSRSIVIPTARIFA
ncbi:MAG TPA: N-acyl homoserine lactonase family protein [Phototrophicaceae bacterium]|nr:N-acyl homoserine lactonase family protein [Phototrophicaceae bacterium]